MHVTHQAQWISETYRRRAGLRVSTLDRVLDGAVILGSLYTVAMYKFVAGQVHARNLGAPLPELPQAAVGRAGLHGRVRDPVSLLRRADARRDPARRRRAGRGSSSWRRRSALAFIIPLFDNLDVAFQGFNTWHSLQYLALTWFILSRKADTGDIGSSFVRKISGTSHTVHLLRLDDRRDAARRCRVPDPLAGLRRAAGPRVLRRRPLVPADPLLLRPHPLPRLRHDRAGRVPGPRPRRRACGVSRRARS